MRIAVIGAGPAGLTCVRQARAAGDVPGVRVVRAEASGDDENVGETQRLVAAGRVVTVVTSDRGLRGRVTDAAAAVHGPRWLRDLFD